MHNQVTPADGLACNAGLVISGTGPTVFAVTASDSVFAGPVTVTSTGGKGLAVTSSLGTGTGAGKSVLAVSQTLTTPSPTGTLVMGQLQSPAGAQTPNLLLLQTGGVDIFKVWVVPASLVIAGSTWHGGGSTHTLWLNDDAEIDPR